MCTFSFPFSSPLLSFQYVYLSNPLIIRLCTLQLPCLLLYFRLRRTQKKKSWRLSACSMTTKQARSPSGTWSGWPKSWGRTSQTKNCRYASTKPHASFSSPHPCIVLTSFPPLCLWRRWLTKQTGTEMERWTSRSSCVSWRKPAFTDGVEEEKCFPRVMLLISLLLFSNL